MEQVEHEARLRALVEVLLSENQKLNLTAVREPGLAWAKHVLDSLQGIETGLFDEAVSIVDVGAGAGFPGLPLAIERPHVRLTALEATRKKCAFIEETMQLFNIAGEVINARAEAAGHDKARREKFGVAVCRAVGSFAEVAELCLPFVHVGGHAILWRGEEAPEEARAGKQVLARLGGRAAQVLPYTLPEHSGRYHLVVIEKEKPTPHGFPRRDGLPKSRPLA
jgi:16S rRNA (guanine527-N7)-methyltransferase